MENLWEMIAKARGIELGDEFKWSNFTDKYRIRESGLEYFDEGQWCNSLRAIEFISGIGEIEKLPFRPQIGEDYYTYTNKGEVFVSFWDDCSIDYVRFIAGLVFRTRDEAINYLPTWKERISKL